VKRRDSFRLAQVFDDVAPSPRPSTAAAAAIPLSPAIRPPSQAVGFEKRIHTRFDKAFLVMVGSELYGDTYAIARNVSAGGILVEMPYAPPLGTVVTVHFQHPRDHDQLDEIVARAEVKHHHYLNFTGSNDDAASARAIGLRFIEFLDPNERIAPERVH
jgi:hypothetical protein